MPSIRLVAGLGYLRLDSRGDYGIERYVLTEKAFALLERPAVAPRVFISYRREASSALALLIEARLRLVGAEGVFLDKAIPAGEDWRKHLNEAVRNSRYVICLISPTSLESEWVRQEIAWAEGAGCTIISMWHNGARVNSETPAALASRQAIFVGDETAKGYETAVNELLNSLGYRTY
jgi:hypothetical protein